MRNMCIPFILYPELHYEDGSLTTCESQVLETSRLVRLATVPFIVGRNSTACSLWKAQGLPLAAYSLHGTRTPATG